MSSEPHPNPGGPNVGRPLPPAVLAAEARTLEYLNRGEWRKARDEIKPLVRLAPERFLPLLVRTNEALAQEFIEAGQPGAARQVLDYLRRVAPEAEGVIRGLEFELSCPEGTGPERVAWLERALGDSTGAVPEAVRVRYADRLVMERLGGTGEGTDGTELPGEGPAAHGMAIRRALQALGEGDMDGAREWARRVPHRSALRHWALFVRGVAAFHEGDRGMVERCLRGLPEGSVPARASEAYLVLAPDAVAPVNVGQPVPDRLVEGWKRMLGKDGEIETVVRADRLWRRGAHAESYRAVRDGIGSFPTVADDWVGALSQFYFHATPSLAEEAGEKYVASFEERRRNGAKNDVEAMLMVRLTGLAGSVGPGSKTADQTMDEFLEWRRKVRGENRHLESLAFSTLGASAAQMAPPDPFGWQPPRPLDARRAVAHFERAIQLDPANLLAHLRLQEMYRHLRETSLRNRLLDAMAERFPDSKPVLVLAGGSCLDRKVYRKGLTYLLRARDLDPLDPEMPALILAGWVGLARQHFERGEADRAREALKESETWVVEDARDYRRGRWAVMAHWGVIERMFGDAGTGQQRIEQARELAPFRTAVELYCHHVQMECATKKLTSTPHLDALRGVRAGSVSIQEVCELIRIAFHWVPEPGPLRKHPELRVVCDFVRRIANTRFHPEDARELVQLCRRDPFRNERDRLLDVCLRLDPEHPYFRLTRLVEDRALMDFDPDGFMNDLEEIREEAERRGDKECLSEVQQIIGRLSRRDEGDGLPGPNLVENEDEDENSWDDLPADVMPAIEAMPEFKSMVAGLLLMPEPEFKQMTGQCPPGVPRDLYDALMGEVRRRREQARGGSGGKPRRVPKIDSSQPELF
ncbi:MAG: hypothetical protein KF833_02155 [Verrucomicrobiae bacterium]|nr:hypothetical protein [Verrucomicrobiae bacterium]